MLYENTLFEIENNVNTGVEYEIALFYKLLKNQPNEQIQVLSSIRKRPDVSKINSIISQTDISIIEGHLNASNLTLEDVSFETQNDLVGPSDIVMKVTDKSGVVKDLGLSVKYANTCTLNSTSARFITKEQRKEIEDQYPCYKKKFIDYMKQKFGNASNWHRKRCPVTNEFIDILRDAVVKNWNDRKDKRDVLSTAFQDNSPITFWIVTYDDYGYSLNISPVCIELSRSDEVKVIKSEKAGQFVEFSLDGKVYAKMQVKFNNGLLELNLDHRGRRKREKPSVIIDDIEFIDGDPFGSWNFSVEK